MKNIIFIAPPAAGKGTQAKLVSSEYNIPHISTGDLLREEMAKESKIGLYDYVLKNDNLEKSVNIIEEIISGVVEKAVIPSKAYLVNFQKDHFVSPATLLTFWYSSAIPDNANVNPIPILNKTGFLFSYKKPIYYDIMSIRG